MTPVWRRRVVVQPKGQKARGLRPFVDAAGVSAGVLELVVVERGLGDLHGAESRPLSM